MLDLSNVGISNDETYSEEETSQVVRAIAEAENRLQELGPDVLVDPPRGSDGETRQLSHFLKAERDEIVDTIFRYKAAIAPHKRLPEDVLRHIFILIAGWEDIRFPFRDGVHTPIQYMLSHVCSAWRRIALDIPRLWNKVYVCNPTRRTVDIAHHWFPRAGSLGLDLRLVMSRDSHLFRAMNDEALEEVRKEIEVLYELTFIHSIRMFSLSLWQLPVEHSSPLRQLTFEYMRKFAKKLASVEEISLAIEGGAAWPQIPLPFELDLASDKLRTLHLDLGVQLYPSPVGGLWYNLEDLRLSGTYIQASQFLTVLRQCKLLRRLALTFAREGTILHPEPCLLPRLRELDLDINPLGNNTTPLLMLNCPVLESLKITTYPGFSWSQILDERIVRGLNFSLLKSFTLRDSEITCPGATTKLFEIASSLRCVELPCGAVLSDQLIDNIATGKVVPQLETLIVQDYGYINKFCHMAETRYERTLASVPPGEIKLLKHIELLGNESSQVIHYNRLSSLESKGIQVKINIPDTWDYVWYEFL